MDGGVCCTLEADPAWQGYSGTLHGGMICTLLDAAMTHCLFSLGLEGVTADLQVRFLNPVPVPGDCLLSLEAELLRHRLGTFWVTARLTCVAPSSPIFATAKARFRPHRDPARS